MKPRILHLTADYPDQIKPTKTRAISGLVEGTSENFDHQVVSLNRTGGLIGVLQPGRVLGRSGSGAVFSLRYSAPPAAMAIGPAMRRLADFLVPELTASAMRPDLIQGHKLTVEGLLAQQLAKRLGVPYVLTLQGNTDQKLLTQRPDRLFTIRRVWQDARGIMAFAPWTAQWCAARLGQSPLSVAVIPCLLGQDAILPPVPGSGVVRTAFHLDFWKNKNISTLLEAISRLSQQFPALRLEIAGGGSPHAKAAIEREIAKYSLSDRVSLAGSIAPEAIQTWFNGAALCALPSRRESFGMVFAEALLAGTPVIYPRGAAIEGFFSDQPFARSVAPDDPNELAAAIGNLLSHQAEAKARLAQAQTTGELSLFRRNKVLANYSAFLWQALK